MARMNPHGPGPTAADWNESCPPGTSVIFCPLRRRSGPVEPRRRLYTVTVSEAWDFFPGQGTPVVHVEGVPAPVSLTSLVID